MHDYLDILGLSTNAPASEVRRACARRVRRWHPDFPDERGVMAAVPTPGVLSTVRMESDVAIDFADMAAFVDRIQATFFVDGR